MNWWISQEIIMSTEKKFHSSLYQIKETLIRNQFLFKRDSWTRISVQAVVLSFLEAARNVTFSHKMWMKMFVSYHPNVRLCLKF